MDITSVRLRHFKAFEDFSVSLQSMNVLVGPNNSGKSTLLNTFRVLAAGIRRAKARSAEVVQGPDGQTYGHRVPTDDMPMSLENVHTNYDADTPTTVTFQLANKNSLVLYFPPEGGCILIPKPVARTARTPTAFKREFPLIVEFVPILGPLEHDEQRVELQTVQRNLPTHRASRNFRNYWRYFPDDFVEFSNMIRRTWPGMEIIQPEIISLNSVVMFCQESGIPRELYWAGFGFQIWCQTLTHIIRARNADMLVVDEPDIYLHPELQRQLLSILRQTKPSILLATHSTEMISEAEPDEILLIDKSRRSAQRLKDVTQVQHALEILGSGQNITLTQLARTRRVMFVEGTDFKILGRFARILDLASVANQTDFTVVPTEGFSQWQKLQALKWGFERTLGYSIVLGVVFDRDFRCDEEIANIQADLMASVSLVHFHHRKELENYLLLPNVLKKAIRSRLHEVARRGGSEPVEAESIESILQTVTDPLKAETQSRYIGSRIRFLRGSHASEETITEETLGIFEAKWAIIDTRMEIVPGKKVLTDLNRYLQDVYGINLTPLSIIAQFRPDEVPEDLASFLRRVNNIFRKATP